MRTRVRSVDVVRGAVMVLMALDHVRVYSGLPAGGPTPGIFYTRWITHFCAPAFVFLAGTAAFLHARNAGDPRVTSRFLATRGLMLVVLELTVIRLAWTFNTDFAHYNLAGVIWMLGWCMILMSLLVRLSTKTIAILGVVVMFAQQLLAPLRDVFPASIRWLFELLYGGGDVVIGPNGPPLAVLYVIVPWIGVMAVGYAFGTVLTREARERDRACIRIGLSATALFLVVATALAVLRPGSEDTPLFARILGQQKYPASQLFLLMTLGPTIALLPLAERARGWLAGVLTVFGRVPMFYYLLHIPLIHVAALVVSLIREGQMNPWLFGNHPMWPPEAPPGYMWSLALLYIVWLIAVALLYVPCNWYSSYKTTHRNALTRYI